MSRKSHLLQDRLHALIVYSNPHCVECHKVRMVLIEKKIDFRVITVNLHNKPPDLMQYSPYNEPPVLVDREVSLYEPAIILEYIEERFPHPPLMPSEPASRALVRTRIRSLDRDWMPHIEAIESSDTAAARKSLEFIKDIILSRFSAFSEAVEEGSYVYTLFDCSFACMIWPFIRANGGLENLRGKEFAPFRLYVSGLYKRPAFRSSLIDSFSKEYGVENTEDIADFLSPPLAKLTRK